MNLFLRHLLAHPVVGPMVLLLLGTIVLSVSAFLFVSPAAAEIVSFIGCLIAAAWSIFHFWKDLRRQKKG